MRKAHGEVELNAAAEVRTGSGSDRVLPIADLGLRIADSP